MKVSVVIPSFDANAALETCLLSLLHQRLDPEDSYEVVVADDGSTDGTDAMVERLARQPIDLRYLYLPRTPSSGRSTARNAGIAAATGDVVVMSDADQILPPTFLAEHLRYHRRRSDLVVVGPRGYLGAGQVDRHRLAAEFTFDALPPVAGGDSRQRVLQHFGHNLNNLASCWHYLFSCNASVRREHLVAAGCFDDGFTGWGLEDSELGYRLRRRGLAFAFNSAAVLYHQHAQVVGQQMYQDWRRNLSRFTDMYDSAEVSAQWIFDRSFDPSVTDLTWLDCCIRFEHAVRALHGRLPGAEHQLVEVDADNLVEVISQLPERAAHADLLVLDHVGDPLLAETAQCLQTSRELAYFSRPDPATRERLLATHRIAGQEPTR